MRSFVGLAALAWVLASAPSGASAQTATTAAPGWPVGAGLTADPSIRFGVLPNGMRYAIRKNATPPGGAALRLRFDVGSLNEAENQRGVAHMIEHMVFNGTRNVPEGEFVKRLERHGLKFGPDTNASTGFDQTIYMLDLPKTDVGTVDTALFLLREVADKALMEAAAIDAERPIILAEERTRATPQMRQVMDELAFIYAGQPLPNRLPIGTPESIRSVSREQFVAFYNAYYRPEKATLVAVGDFDVPEMEAKIREGFADWKGEGPAGAGAVEGSPSARKADADVFVDAAVPTRTSLAWVRPADLSADTAMRRGEALMKTLAIAVLNRRLERIAATAKPSPFIVAQAVKAQLADTADLTQLIAVAQPGQWKPALAAIDQEQRRLVQHGVTKSELDREIANLRSALKQAATGQETRTSATLAMEIVEAINEDQAVIGPVASLDLFERTVTGLTAERVNRAMATLFTGAGPLMYLTSPAPVAGDKQALLSAYDESRKVAVAAPAAQQLATWPYGSFGTPGRVTERRALVGVDATAVRFANGVRLTVKPTSFAKDEIQVAVRVGDGLLDLTTPKAPLAGLLQFGAFQGGGLGKLTAEQLSEALTGRTASASFAIDENAFVLAGGSRPVDFAVQMQLLAAYVSDPGWQPTGYDRIKGFFPQLLKQIAATPSGGGGSPGVWERDGSALLRGGDRRWTLPNAAEVTASSIADARALVGGALAGDPIEVVIVGDITVDEAIRQTAATFGALPARRGASAKAGALAFPAGTATPVRLTHGGRADQGFGFIAWPTRGKMSDVARSRALDALAAVFQLRLNERIRERGGLSYSPVAGQTVSDVFDHGYLSGQVEAPPEKLDLFLTEAAAIADELRTKPVSADELQRALKPLVEGQRRSRTTNAFWLGALDGTQTDARMLAAVNSQLSDYEKVDSATLQRMAVQFLQPGKAYKVVIVPEKK